MLLQGFYYDAYYGDLGLNDDHFKQIESGTMKAVKVSLNLLSQMWFVHYIYFTIFAYVVKINGNYYSSWWTKICVYSTLDIPTNISEEP